MKPFNVLVFPGSTEIGLEVCAALRDCKEVRLFSAAAGVSNHAPYAFARHEVVPSVHEAGWLPALNDVIGRNAIDYVYPAHDDVGLALAEHAAALEARIVGSPVTTHRVARSKSQTYRWFSGSLPVPRVYASSEEVASYPVFVKPDRGEGSHRCRTVHDSAQLDQTLREFRDRDEEPVVLEYLPGEEVTVDCFSDRERGILFCRGRRRVRTRNGIAMNSKSWDAPIFSEYAAIIASRLPFHGAWFYQLKRGQDDAFKLLEVAPRLAGTSTVHRVAGVNFPLLSIYEQERMPIEILANDVAVEIDRGLANRYRHNLSFSSVYVDLDDTLVLAGKVNVRLLAFLYQCINDGIPVVLLTRTTADLDEVLTRHRLACTFDEIIQVGPTRPKSDFIRRGGAIFIDDSFRERKAVSAALGIPTFDCSMVEMLLDDRS